jgi:hypothetical protein
MKNGAQFVEAIGAFAEDIEAQINFGVSGNSNFAHGLVSSRKVSGAMFLEIRRWRETK